MKYFKFWQLPTNLRNSVTFDIDKTDLRLHSDEMLGGVLRLRENMRRRKNYDSSNGGTNPISKPEIVWPKDKNASLVCGDEANKARNFKTQWEQLCDADGTKYWVKLYAKTY